jgi:hypothetical protein
MAGVGCGGVEDGGSAVIVSETRVVYTVNEVLRQ